QKKKILRPILGRIGQRDQCHADSAGWVMTSKLARLTPTGDTTGVRLCCCGSLEVCSAVPSRRHQASKVILGPLTEPADCRPHITKYIQNVTLISRGLESLDVVRRPEAGRVTGSLCACVDA